MPQLIAPGVCRYAVNQLYGGRPVVNILDFRIDTTGSPADRGQACFEMAGIIINEWTDQILLSQTDDITAQTVSWIDLDSANGTTGERSSTDQETWPQNGQGTSGSAPGNVALRVNKNTISARGQRGGRMYLAGVSEDLTAPSTPNQITGAAVADLNPRLATFLGNLNQEGDVSFEYESALVVVHTVDDVFTSTSDVTSLTVDQTLSSQRRRLRG